MSFTFDKLHVMLYQHSIGIITLPEIWSGDNLEIMAKVRKFLQRELRYENFLKYD